MTVKINILSSAQRFLIGSAAVLLGCTTGGDSVVQPSFDLSTVPWKLTLNHHAIVSLRNTPVQLSTTVVDVNGKPMTGLPPVEYTTTDTSVKVDASGRVSGSSFRSQVLVYATMRNLERNWTVADTLRISIDTVAYSFASYKMAANRDFSLPVPANRTASFPVRLFNGAGDTVRVTPGGAARAPLAYYTSTARADSIFLSNGWTSSASVRQIPSQTTIYATSLIFGTQYTDSVKFRGTYPDSVTMYILRASSAATPSPSTMGLKDITIIKNGYVAFRNNNNSGEPPVDIVFDNLAGVINGNLPSIAYNTVGVVQFPNTGKFTYKSTKMGVTGTITVVNP